MLGPSCCGEPHALLVRAPVGAGHTVRIVSLERLDGAVVLRALRRFP